MVNAWLAPEYTETLPDGLMVPLAPADALMVKVVAELAAKVAEMV